MPLLETPFEPWGGLRAELLESPVWDAANERLLVADVRGGRIVALDGGGAVAAAWRFEPPLGCFGLADDGRLVVALRDAVLLFDPATGAREPLARIEAGEPRTRLNDGKVGPDGAFHVGTMDDTPARAAIGAVYRVTRGGAERRFGGVAVSNGLAWSPDGRTMHHADSRAGRIDAYPFDPTTGAPGARRMFAGLDDAVHGRPDGAAMDAAGRYWSAGVTTGRVHVWNPDGALAESLPVGTGAPTMPAFGGADGRDVYVTSLRRDGDADRNAGRLFRARASVAGAPIPRFRTA